MWVDLPDPRTVPTKTAARDPNPCTTTHDITSAPYAACISRATRANTTHAHF